MEHAERKISPLLSEKRHPKLLMLALLSDRSNEMEFSRNICGSCELFPDLNKRYQDNTYDKLPRFRARPIQKFPNKWPRTESIK